jgi:hypothetical protein
MPMVWQAATVGGSNTLLHFRSNLSHAGVFHLGSALAPLKTSVIT